MNIIIGLVIVYILGKLIFRFLEFLGWYIFSQKEEEFDLELEQMRKKDQVKHG